MFSMLAMSIYSLIEGIFIGHLIGEAAFAALNIAMPFVMINFSLADLIGVGSSVPISIALGRKNNDEANNVFSCSIIMIFAAAIFMGLLMFFGSPLFVRLIGADGELAELAVKYVRIYAIFGPVTTVLFAMDNFLRISGFVKSSMLLNIFMSFFTIGLLAIFIGALKMNLEGSALATCISMSTCVMIAFIPFLLKKTVLKFTRPRFSSKMIMEITACGTPVFLTNIAGRVAAIFLNTALLRIGGPELGQTAVAAYSVLMYASEMIQPMLYGLSDSIQPAIGYNWGRRSLERVKSLAKTSFAACGTVSLIGTAIMLIFPEAIVSMFVNSDEAALLEMSVHALRIFCTAYIFRWIGFCIQGFYGAIEKPLPASIISICNALIFPLIFIFALAPFGLNGLWLNMTATSVMIMILALAMLLKSQKKLKFDIEKTKSHAE